MIVDWDHGIDFLLDPLIEGDQLILCLLESPPDSPLFGGFTGEIKHIQPCIFALSFGGDLKLHLCLNHPGHSPKVFGILFNDAHDTQTLAHALLPHLDLLLLAEGVEKEHLAAEARVAYAVVRDKRRRVLFVDR